MRTFSIAVKRKEFKGIILAGDVYTIEATSERLARKQLNQILKTMYMLDIPRIAYVEEKSLNKR